MALLANAWVEKGRVVTLLTLDDGKVPPFYPLAQNITHVPLGVAADSGGSLWRGLANNIGRIRTLRRAIARTRPDLVVSFLDQVNVITVAATRGMKVPVVVAERTDPAHATGGFWRLARRWAYRHADALIAQTESAASYLSEWTGRTAIVLPNPVLPVPPVEPAPLARPTIVAVGRLAGVKNFDLLIGAFARVAGRFSDWHLAIAGEGPERGKLEALIEKLGLTERVHLLGLVEQPARVLRAADLFALSSRHEGFPNALCEAMACGLAVIATDCAGPRAIVRPEIDGLLVPRLDEPAMAQGLSRLMDDAGLRARLGEKAREVLDRFSYERTLGEWDTVFERLLRRGVT